MKHIHTKDRSKICNMYVYIYICIIYTHRITLYITYIDFWWMIDILQNFAELSRTCLRRPPFEVLATSKKNPTAHLMLFSGWIMLCYCHQMFFLRFWKDQEIHQRWHVPSQQVLVPTCLCGNWTQLGTTTSRQTGEGTTLFSSTHVLILCECGKPFQNWF